MLQKKSTGMLDGLKLRLGMLLISTVVISALVLFFRHKDSGSLRNPEKSPDVEEEIVFGTYINYQLHIKLSRPDTSWHMELGRTALGIDSTWLSLPSLLLAKPLVSMAKSTKPVWSQLWVIPSEEGWKAETLAEKSFEETLEVCKTKGYPVKVMQNPRGTSSGAMKGIYYVISSAESGENRVKVVLSIEGDPGVFLLICSVPKAEYKKHKSAFEAIIRSIRFL